MGVWEYGSVGVKASEFLSRIFTTSNFQVFKLNWHIGTLAHRHIEMAHFPVPLYFNYSYGNYDFRVSFTIQPTGCKGNQAFDE
jgi:hypothetical protein